VLCAQAKLAQGEEGRKLLEGAVEAYQHALEVYTRDSQPVLWAMVQGNLGEALRELGGRTEGKAGEAHLSTAAEAFKQAMEVYAREQQPEDQAWAKEELERTRQLQAQRSQAARPE
jgi:hypothetical protein